MKAIALFACAVVVGAFASSAGADDAPLLETLRQKGVLTQPEYERLKGTQLAPEQRSGLIELLREKGILTGAEANRLAQPAPVAAPVAAPSPAAPVAAAAGEKPAAPLLGYDEGFFIRTPDGNFALRFNSRVAGNLFFFEPGTTQTDTATIDRARLSVDATVYRYFRMRLENDFTSSSGLRDAWLALNYSPELNLQVGQYKVPFSYEELLSKRYIDFVERAAVVNSTVNSSRDIGLMLYGAVFGKRLQYQLAGMNGAGQNVRDNNSEKDVIARVVVAPFVDAGPEPLRSLNVGGAVTYGFQPQESKSGSSVTTSSIAGTTETTFTFFPAVERHGDRLRAGAHVAWLDGPYSLSSEYINTQESRSEVNGTPLPDLDTDGAYIGGTWLLTGETKPLNARLHPARPFLDVKAPGWGAWEAALRYEYFKLRHAPDPTSSLADNRYDAIVAGMNWYPNEFLRFSLNYLYGSFDKQGNSQSPNPDKRSNNAVLGRAQFEF